MSDQGAFDAARRQFGNRTIAREGARRMHVNELFEAIAQDARYAVRGFLKNPVFTATAIFAMALGIGSTSAVFSVIDRILFRPLPYPNAERLVSFGFRAPIEPTEFMLGTDYFEWRDHQTGFEAMTSWSDNVECSITEQHPEHLFCSRVESSFLPVFGVEPLAGRNFTREEDAPHGPSAAMISYGLWQSRFAGDPGVIGRSISLDGVPTAIVGVLPRGFELPTLAHADILVPRKLDPARQRRPNTGAVLRAFARLKPVSQSRRRAPRSNRCSRPR